MEITDRGRQVLADHPDRVDVKILRQFPEFREFRSRKGTRAKGRAEHVDNTGEESLSTPRERMEEAVGEARAAVEGETLSRVVEQDPAFLERLVLRILLSMGYGGSENAAEHLGQTNDEGVDGVIRQDSLGLDRIYVQAKRYTQQPIGRPAIQAFVGALHDTRPPSMPAARDVGQQTASLTR